MSEPEPINSCDDGRPQSSSASGSTSRSLLVGLRENDSLAWCRLVELYAPFIYHCCRRLEVPEHDIADVFQEVVQSVVRSIDRFHKERPEDTFRGWLRTITRNKVCDYFRRQGRQPGAAGGTEVYKRLLQLPQHVADCAGQEDRQVHSLVFRRALTLIQQDFEERTWLAFWRIVVDGRSPKDVADELSMSPGAARVAKCRVLQRLRKELGDVCE